MRSLLHVKLVPAGSWPCTGVAWAITFQIIFLGINVLIVIIVIILDTLAEKVIILACGSQRSNKSNNFGLLGGKVIICFS